MRFTTREDIGLPAETVFAAISDFDGFERAALRRGADVTRTGVAGEPGSGWRVKFRHRGRERELVSTIARFEPPAGIASRGSVGGIDGVLAIELLVLAPERTRLVVDLDVTPRTLPARLALQSLRLAKGNLTRRFKTRVERFARELEARHRRPTRG